MKSNIKLAFGFIFGNIFFLLIGFAIGLFYSTQLYNLFP